MIDSHLRKVQKRIRDIGRNKYEECIRILEKKKKKKKIGILRKKIRIQNVLIKWP